MRYLFVLLATMTLQGCLFFVVRLPQEQGTAPPPTPAAQSDKLIWEKPEAGNYDVGLDHAECQMKLVPDACMKERGYRPRAVSQ